MSDAADTVTPSILPRLCEYAASVTAERLDRMLSHIDGVRKAEDPEPVHQMRVWSRRSRAALEIFRVCFKGRAVAEIEREVKAATDALSEARDLDVMIASLSARAAKLPASHRGGIESFIALLHSQRDQRQAAVAAAATDLETHHLAQRFKDVTQKAPEKKKPAISTSTARGKGKEGKRRHG